MTRLVLTLSLLPLLSLSLLAQVPQGINYQAAARDGEGKLLADQRLMLKVNLYEKSTSTRAVYTELHEVETSDLGLFNVVIGAGMALENSIEAVDWSTGDVWMELSIDAGADGDYDIVHTNRLLSVPYAFHAGTASAISGNSDVRVPEPPSKYWQTIGNNNTNPDVNYLGTSDTTALVFRTSDIERVRIMKNGDVVFRTDIYVDGVISGDGSGLTNLPPDTDSDPTNELQTLSQSGTDVTLSDGGGTVSVADNDNDPTNEIQTLSLSAGTLTLSDGGGTIVLDADTDADPTNEIQTLSQSGLNVTLSDGGGTVSVADDDNDPSNEFQTLSKVGNLITLSDGGGTVDVDDDDNDVTNELQDLSLSGNSLTLTGDPTSVDLSPLLVNTDNQMLTLSGFDLSISGGNTITLPSGGGGGGDSGAIWSYNAPHVYYTGGDVGIGTSTPDASLHIDANSSLSDPHLWLHENGNDYARLNFDNNNGSNYWTIAAYIASNVKNDRFNIWNGATGDILTITGDGEMGLNVGISPKTTFHIGNGHRVLWGTDTLGNGDKLMFLPDLHAFRVGTVATGAASTYWNRDSIGLYSFASGLNTRAQGFGATAMGRDTEATNSYAFASGFFTNADGQYSTAMGFNTDAFALGSTALGYSTDAEQNYSFAAGYFAEAQAIYSIAIGNAVRAQSFASMAVGRYNVGGGSATSWLSGDPIFEIGIGTGPSSRANAVTVRKNGNVGIGTTVPLDRLHVNGRIRLQTVEYFEDGGTSEIAVRGDLRPSADNTYDIGTSSLRYDDVFATSGTVNTSDRRSKTNIQELSYGLNEVLRLQPVSYEWRDHPMSETKLGLIAQDVYEVLPEVVKTHDWQASEENETHGAVVELERLGIYYSDIIPVLIRAIQEQDAVVKEQEDTIAELTGRVERMEAALEALGIFDEIKGSEHEKK